MQSKQLPTPDSGSKKNAKPTEFRIRLVAMNSKTKKSIDREKKMAMKLPKIKVENTDREFCHSLTSKT